MKKLIILLISVSTYAQNTVSFSVSQDLKLGNEKTIDVILTANLEGKQFSYGYFTLQPFYEYSNVNKEDFHRYGVNAIWFINRLIVPKLELGFGGGLGVISRYGAGNVSYGLINEISYPISKRFDVMFKNEFVRRTDLKDPKTNYNLAIGLKFNI